jgi:hypothetical protein
LKISFCGIAGISDNFSYISPSSSVLRACSVVRRIIYCEINIYSVIPLTKFGKYVVVDDDDDDDDDAGVCEQIIDECSGSV